MYERELGIQSQLKEIVKSDVKVWFLLFKYAPHLLNKPDIKTFEDLKKSYKGFTKGMTEVTCETWLAVDENVQRGAKWLLNKTHQHRLIELYNQYYQKAMEDVNAFKAFTSFSESFFKQNDKNKLMDLINNVDVSEDDESNEANT